MVMDTASNVDNVLGTRVAAPLADAGLTRQHSTRLLARIPILGGSVAFDDPICGDAIEADYSVRIGFQLDNPSSRERLGDL